MIRAARAGRQPLELGPSQSAQISGGQDQKKIDQIAKNKAI